VAEDEEDEITVEDESRMFDEENECVSILLLPCMERKLGEEGCGVSVSRGAEERTTGAVGLGGGGRSEGCATESACI